jgi:hypothetical protein
LFTKHIALHLDDNKDNMEVPQSEGIPDSDSKAIDNASNRSQEIENTDLRAHAYIDTNESSNQEERNEVNEFHPDPADGKSILHDEDKIPGKFPHNIFNL